MAEQSEPEAGGAQASGTDAASEIDVFKQAREVRRAGPAARALADRHFLETLVRLHRAGEGEPYTGLEPAGSGTTPTLEQTGNRRPATGNRQ